MTLSTGDTDEAARRVCLLTGAGGTLGSAFCHAYGSAYDIVAVCRRRVPTPSQYETFVDPLSPNTPLDENQARVHVVHADLEASGQIERVVDIALARFGRIDLLVNSAMYSRSHPAGLLDAAGTTEDFARHFEMNVAVPLRLASQVAVSFWMTRPDENRTHNRNVVNVSSVSGLRAYPGGQAVYGASKAALNNLTKHQSTEFASFGVRVNALSPNRFPGIVDTTAVLAGITRLDHDSATGGNLVIDKSD